MKKLSLNPCSNGMKLEFSKHMNKLISIKS